MKKINIIYFAYLVPGRWQSFLESQLRRLNSLKELMAMSDVYINLSGSQLEIDKAALYVNSHFAYMKIYSTDIKNRYEYIGIKCLWEIASKYRDSYCLYFHTKGITSDRSWGHMYEKILFDKTIKPYYKVLQLFDNDKSINKIGFLSAGDFIWHNFFWVRSSYVSQCQKPIIDSNKYYFEQKWLKTGLESKVYQLYSKSQGLKNTTINEADYIISSLSIQLKVDRIIGRIGRFLKKKRPIIYKISKPYFLDKK